MVHTTSLERHPFLRAWVASMWRPVRHFRDWMHVVGSVMPASTLAEFLIIDDGTALAGKFRSFIDQNVYLFGWAHRISANGIKIFGGSRASPRGPFERTTTSYRLLHAAPGLTR